MYVQDYWIALPWIILPDFLSHYFTKKNPQSFGTESIFSVLRCGWRVHFLTRTGVSDHYGKARFIKDRTFDREEGSSIMEVQGEQDWDVRIIRLADIVR